MDDVDLDSMTRRERVAAFVEWAKRKLDGDESRALAWGWPATLEDLVAVVDSAEGPRGAEVAAISKWIDGSPSYVGVDPEAVLWRRTMKVVGEAGEVDDALRGYLGENPRKGVTNDRDDVVEELLDVALAALGAVEHWTGNEGRSVALLAEKVGFVLDRAGIALPSVDRRGARPLTVEYFALAAALGRTFDHGSPEFWAVVNMLSATFPQYAWHNAMTDGAARVTLDDQTHAEMLAAIDAADEDD